MLGGEIRTAAPDGKRMPALTLGHGTRPRSHRAIGETRTAAPDGKRMPALRLGMTPGMLEKSIAASSQPPTAADAALGAPPQTPPGALPLDPGFFPSGERKARNR